VVAGKSGATVEQPRKHELHVRDYDLAATLDSGQVFRWRRVGDAWEGVVVGRWVRISSQSDTLVVETAGTSDLHWLHAFLRLEEDLELVLGSFPNDEPMQAAVAACRGLRLLRQDPWECLASFICSSTKQIVQIRQIVHELCCRHGELIPAPEECGPQFAFPHFIRLASLEEQQLRDCKLGFRAPYLLGTARLLAQGAIDLESLRSLEVDAARDQLLRCPGVGRKIADCVLLFAYGFQEAFPIDVWVTRAMQRLYFPRARRLNAKRLHRFSATHFGPNAGYAQQYLFHYARTHLGRKWAVGG
jgi:N-glycosylase/DNA lyase